MDSGVRWIGGPRGPARAAMVAALACSVAACGSIMNMAPDMSGFRLPDRSTFLPTQSSVSFSISPTNRITSADLVDAHGQCAAPAAQTDTSSHGVALDMTECQVVRSLGQPQAIEIPAPGSVGYFGTSDGRHVVLTYRSGDHPGIYDFTGGRLTAIQRTDESPPEAAKKPARKTRSAPRA